MERIEKVYLAGLGAIGGAVSSRICEFDPGCLKIIADKDRIARYTKNGISINGKTYSFHYVEPDKAYEKADLLLIAVKQHNLARAIEDVRGFVGSETVILSLLNGITSEELLAGEFGAEKLLYSFVVGTDTVKEGTATKFANLGKIVFGERTNGGLSPKVAAVKEFFERVHMPYAIPENMLREMWWKFMMNVGVNQVSAVLRAPYGIFCREGEARELMLSASREVVEISRKAGIGLTEEDIERYTAVLDGISPLGKTSMLQDVEAGRKTEVEIFAGTVIALGKKYGVPTPVNDILYRIIRSIEEMRSPHTPVHCWPGLRPCREE